MQPDGPVDTTIGPVEISDATRYAVATLMAPSWRPRDHNITQAYGFCFLNDGDVVLICGEPDRWNLPGGTVEPGETPEQTLVREVAEEACATVTDFRYLASQHVWDPDNPDGLSTYYQSRWWARVRLDTWEPKHETIARTTVNPDHLVTSLFWREKTIAARLLELAVAVEHASRH